MPVPTEASVPVGTPVSAPLSVARVNAEPCASFLYTFQPSSFALLEVPKATVDGFECPGGKFWLPIQTRIVNAAGANGVRTLQDGEPPSEAWKYVLQIQKEAGNVLIDPSSPIPAECLPKGASPGGYLREVAVSWKGDNGVRYITPWDLCQAVPGAPARWSVDRQRYALWLWWLVATEQVPPVHEAYVSDAQREKGQLVSVIQMRAQTMPAEVAAKKISDAKSDAKAAEDATIAKPSEVAQKAPRTPKAPK